MAWLPACSLHVSRVWGPFSRLLNVALYRKYRPATFGEVIGQEQVTRPLSTALDNGRIAHAYLFSAWLRQDIVGAYPRAFAELCAWADVHAVWSVPVVCGAGPGRLRQLGRDGVGRGVARRC